MLPTSKIVTEKSPGKNEYLLETSGGGTQNIAQARAPVPSVWHRPQCNIGPGISPVAISIMDDSRKRPGSPGLASSTRRRRANDQMNALRILGVITIAAAAVVVVATVTASVKP